MEKYQSLIMCVDFDGTIVTHEYPKIGQDIDAFPWLQKFQELGILLVLETMRCEKELKVAIEHCGKYGIKFYGVNVDPKQHEWTSSPKAYAHMSIDDRNVRCPLKFDPKLSGRPFVDWEKVGPMVLKLIGFTKPEEIVGYGKPFKG